MWSLTGPVIKPLSPALAGGFSTTGSQWKSLKVILKEAVHGFLSSFFYKALEEGIATCSSILAWTVPWAEEPGGLQSLRSQKVGDS